MTVKATGTSPRRSTNKPRDPEKSPFMPDLLLELFSEEIPARMQRQAAEDLRRLVTDGLVEAGLTYEGAKAFVTPRRLALTVHGVTARSADVTEEQKGPRVGAPEKAIEGFLRGAGLASIDEAKIQSDPKKGDFYVARGDEAGPGGGGDRRRDCAGRDPRISRGRNRCAGARARRRPIRPSRGNERKGLRAFAGCGRSARSSALSGRRRRSRSSSISRSAGIAAGNVTFGHRFMAGGEPIRVRRFDDYVPELEAAKVVLDPSGGRRSSRRRRKTSPSRRGSRWSRIRGCWRRWRGWSNGRSC